MTPANVSSPENFGHFKLLSHSLFNGILPVSVYVSQKTGLTVVVGEIEGPVVSGYISLATEAHDDDGLPHTLEHLVFLGSEDYPYEGVLDLLANRCLASGTNAWTDIDNTCYTLTTASEGGFLSLLPIYLDHIFYPTLTDSAFITEVHHINGEGQDGGVVFNEMQGTENRGESIVGRELLRSLYPGVCGYKSETGGIMENLRSSTNNQKVKEYHKQFYRPENCYVIIAGSTTPLAVLKSLEQFELKIISKGERGSYTRPWQNKIPPLVESCELSRFYPTDDESNGMVYIGWRGPSVINDFYKYNAFSVLLKYLTDTPVSPLPKAFVDIPDPFASRVSFSITENSESVITLQFLNVPFEKLDLIKDMFMDVVTNFVNGTDISLDKKRLLTVIHRARLELMAEMEDSPHDIVAFAVGGYQLFGHDMNHLHQRMNYLGELLKLETEPPKFWIELLQTYLIYGKSVVVKGVPNIEEQMRLSKEEEDRVEKRKADYGIDGLKQLENIIDEALAKNKIPPPSEMLRSVPVPSIDSIHFPFVKCYTDLSEHDPRFSFRKVPLHTHLTNIHTNFVHITVVMDSSKLSVKLRPYLRLITSCLLESPIQIGDVLVPYEEVIAQLEEDTFATEVRLGVSSGKGFTCGPYPNAVCFWLQVEPQKYAKGVQWVKSILFDVVFTAERLKILALKLINNVPEYKRSGHSMAYDAMKGILYGKNNNHYGSNVLVQQNFLTELLTKLETPDGVIEVLKDVKNVMDLLRNSENMSLHLAADLDKLSEFFDDIADPWEKVFPEASTPLKNQMNIAPEWKWVKEQVGESCVIGNGAVESGFLILTSDCMVDFNSPDLAPLLVFLQYMSQFEGPIWRLIRGKGLAYSFSALPRPNQGKLSFTFYRSSNIIGAYKQVNIILRDCIKPDAEWDDNLFQSAKNSTIYEVVEKEKGIANVIGEAFVSHFKGVTENFNRELVKKLSKVTIEDLVAIGPKYIAPILDPKLIKVAVVCHPSKVNEISTNFNNMGITTKPYTNIEECFGSLW